MSASPPVEPGPRRDASMLPAVLVVVLAAAAVALLRVPGSTTATGAAGSPGASAGAGEPVTRTVLACPDPVTGRAVDSSVRLGLVAGPQGSGLDQDGAVSLGPVDGTASSRLLTRGRLVDVPGRGVPRVRATGPAAPGLFGFRTDRTAGGGLAVTECGRPRSQWWFTGAGAGLDHSSTLELANLDPGPAVVDLRVLGPDGEVDTVNSRGLVLPPNSTRRIELSDIAPQTDDLALDVRATRGRVVAAVADAYRGRPAGTPGREWLPSADRAGRRVDLAGLPVAATARTLLVANPSDREAVVDVRVSGRSGTFAPAGLDPVTVSPGAIESVDVTGTVPAGEPIALRLRSRVPVVASVRSTMKADAGYAAPVITLTGPAATPLVEDADATVQLSAGSRPARVTVSTYDVQGRRVDHDTVAVAATATRGWRPTKGAAYVVVTPTGRGGVHGAVSYTGGGVATVPLTDLPYREQRPSVRPGLR